jgi:DNA-binding IclR family transcriptional regulator
MEQQIAPVAKNKTVVRSMELLNLFIAHEQLTVSEMVRLSNLPKSTVHRMIGSLEEMGFLEKDPDGKYALGMLFLQFGQLVAERLDIRQIALPIMRQLRDEVEEAVHLVIRSGQEAVYIEKLDTDHPVRLFTKIGRKAPLYAGASSRVILAYLEPEEQEAYLEQVTLKPFGVGTITDKQALREMLHNTRKTGYAVSRSELENYTAEVSAPLFDHTGKIAGAISIAGLEVKFTDEVVGEFAHKLRQAACDISRRLGHG